MKKISIIGAGSWGTTIAKVLAENGHEVRMWCYREETVIQINRLRSSPRLPGISLPQNVIATNNLKECIEHSDIVTVALASKHLPLLDDCSITNQPIVILTKGFADAENPVLVADYIQKRYSSAPVTVLSGPNLAMEIAREQPAAAVIASEDMSLAADLQKTFNGPYFRVYHNQDIIGVSFCGILKNVIAIAAGISDGLLFGNNAKATLISRGMKEVLKIATHFGGQLETVYGLAGLGDLIATCHSNKSRNWQLGHTLSKNISMEAVLSTLTSATEGIKTTEIMHKLAKEQNWELPIISGVYEILFNQQKPANVIQTLMQRELKSES